MDKQSNITVNIGLKERKNRLILGLAFLTACVIVSIIFINSAFYYQGIRFILDYQTGTCPLKAELSQTKLDANFSILGDKLEDEELSLKIKRKSRRALAQAMGIALVLSIITIVLMMISGS